MNGAAAKKRLDVVSDPHTGLRHDDPCTCDECGDNETCEYAFDPLNWGDDYCLAEK